METKTEKIKQQFDAIKTMREIRDKLTTEIMDMNYDQQRAYLDKILSQEKVQHTK